MNNSELNGRRQVQPIDSKIGLDDILTRAMHEDEQAVVQKNPLRVVWQWLWVVVLVAVVLVGLTVGLSIAQTPNYEASIKILVAQDQSADTTNNIQNEVQGLQELTQTMVEAVRTRPVAEDVIQRLGLSESPEEFQDDLNVKQIGSTQFIEVSYEDPSPERAQLIANTVGDVFSQRVNEVSPSANAIAATVWERAAAPSSPVSPDPVRNGFLALALGLMLGLGLAFLLDYLDDNWGSPEDVGRVTGVPTFAVIPTFEAQKSKKKGED